MNKKFSTLLAGMALLTAFSASAKVENGKVYQLTNGGKYLSVEESYTKTDSLVLADPVAKNIKDADYQKTLWKVNYRFVSLANAYAYTLTNCATGNVLTLSKQAEWNFRDANNAFVAPDDVTSVKFAAQLDNKTVVSIVLKDDAEAERTNIVTVDKAETVSAEAVTFDIAAPEKIDMTADLLNNRYNYPFVLTFDKNLDGNPLAGKELVAADVAISGVTDKYVTLKDKATGKYVVVDSTVWGSNLSSEKFWKLTTDAMPEEQADAASKAGLIQDGTILKNGRAAELYYFHIELDPSDNSKMIIYPYATPNNVGTDAEKKTKFCYDIVTNALGQAATKMIAFGNFAGTEKLTVWNKDAAKSTFAEIEVPKSLDPEYTYYVKDMNKATSDEDHSANKYKGQYEVFSFCANGVVHAEEAAAVPTSMWYLTDGDALANMWNTNSTKSGIINVIDEKAGIFSFGTDTIQLVKGPKVTEAQEMGYKKVSANDLINGALSFRLKSVINENLYVTVKDSKVFVANGDLASAYRFKVDPVELEESEAIVPGSNDVKVYKYILTDRLGKTSLAATYEDPESDFTMSDEFGSHIAFLSTGVENEYKMVTWSDIDVDDHEWYGFAVTALAGTGMLSTTDWCNTDNTTFEFARKDAPTYATLNIGHVQITSYTEDDNKMVTSQKDGFAVLKGEGQSILKSDVYTHDSLTLWLDTACVEYRDGVMPLYYLSTSAFTEEGADRNYLMNTLDSAAVDAYKYDAALGQSAGTDVKVARAAFIAASVCGWDSIAVKGDTINNIELNPAAVAFEVAAEYSDEAYKIFSMQQYLNPEYDAEDAEEQGEEYTVEQYLERPAYLAHLNNVVYWTTDEAQAEVFKVIPTSAPTANEGIEAEAAVKVIAGNGAVTVQGATGQTVTIATVLGKVVANEVVASDNATIAAPAGVVFVTVNGETTKVVVK